MSESIIAKRYAHALFQLAQEKSQVDAFASELRTVREVLRNNQSLYSFLQHPRIMVDQKKQLIGESFKSLSTDLVHTLKLLIDRHREGLLPQVIDQFLTMDNEMKGIAEASVYSVRELTDEEIQQVSKTFAAKVDKKSLNITNIVDPSILGGIRVRVGNRIFDGSVSGKLSRMERELVSNKR